METLLLNKTKWKNPIELFSDGRNTVVWVYSKTLCSYVLASRWLADNKSQWYIEPNFVAADYLVNLEHRLHSMVTKNRIDGDRYLYFRNNIEIARQQLFSMLMGNEIDHTLPNENISFSINLPITLINGIGSIANLLLSSVKVSDESLEEHGFLIAIYRQAAKIKTRNVLIEDVRQRLTEYGTFNTLEGTANIHLQQSYGLDGDQILEVRQLIVDYVSDILEKNND